jgi:vitamin B12 transporter
LPPFATVLIEREGSKKDRNESEDLPVMPKKDSRLREKGQGFSVAVPVIYFLKIGYSAGCILFVLVSRRQKMYNTLGLKKILVSLFALLAAAAAHGQQLLDTLYEVGATEVVAQREQVFKAGTFSWKADTTLLKQYNVNTLADVLSQQSGMFVRSYSPGTLATPIMRGTYGVQTAVVWNGFNIQSPMNQLVDLNLLPAFFIDGLEVGYGSQSALYGSGAIGGTISMGQKNREEEGVHGKFFAGFGSFGNFQQGIKLSYRKKWYTGRVRYFNQIVQNNYQYSNIARAGNPTQTLANAQWYANSQLVENYFTINKHTTATLHGWHTQAHRGVAPLMIQNKSEAYQNDDVWRIMGDVKYRATRLEAIARFSWFDERIFYSDALQKPALISDNRAFGFITEAEVRYKLTPRHDVSLGTNNSTYRSTAPNYGTPPPVQYRGAVFASHRYHNKNNSFATSFTMRQEWVTLRNSVALGLLPGQIPGKLKLLPFIPAFGADWNFYKPFWVQGKVSRLYRYPNFNDLYWNPGGNPNLVPESGYSTEARFGYKRKFGPVQFKASAGAYYNDINNWIIWLLGQGGIWSPQNIQRVKARGVEAQMEVTATINAKTTVKIDARYAYTVSTNEKKKSEFDESYKKQLLYVPYHLVAGNVAVNYKAAYLRINGQYTGKQFTSADNTLSLPAFYTLTAFVGTHIATKYLAFDVNLQAKNLLNAQYSVVEWVPMPGRNYLLTIQFNF